MFKRFPLMDNTPGAAGGGAPAAPAAPVAAAPAAPVTPAAPTALQAGAPAPAPAPAPGAAAPGPNDWIPEKHRVMGADGTTLDLEASARKVAEAYGHAEKRIGSGDVPPKTADEYKINVPEAMAEKYKADDLAKDQMLKEFMGKAHAAGLTQKQVDMTIGEYLSRAEAMAGNVSQLDFNDCTKALKDTWKTQEEYDKNLGAAFRAGKAYGGDDFDAILQAYGNDPRVVRMLAKVGAEMKEDTGALPGAQGQTQQSAESLSKTKAYWDKNDPAHAATVEKVRAFYESTFGTKPKVTSALAFQSGR